MAKTRAPDDAAPLTAEIDESTRLSASATGLAFARTRMSAERTLMAVIRTALALISFGFTIFHFFSHLHDTDPALPLRQAPRNFGIALVALGIALLVLGIVYHRRYAQALRVAHQHLIAAGVLADEARHPFSMTLFVAVSLLLLGVLAITNMVFDVVRFG